MIAYTQISTQRYLGSYAGGVTTKEAVAELHEIPAEDVAEQECTEAEAHALGATRLHSILSYAQKRALEYPPAGEYMDAIVKGDTAQAQRYIDACLAVKAKHPKPV